MIERTLGPPGGAVADRSWQRSGLRPIKRQQTLSWLKRSLSFEIDQKATNLWRGLSAFILSLISLFCGTGYRRPPLVVIFSTRAAYQPDTYIHDVI